MQAFFAAVFANLMDKYIRKAGVWLRKTAVQVWNSVKDPKETKEYNEVVQNPEASREDRKKAEDEFFNN